MKSLNMSKVAEKSLKKITKKSKKVELKAINKKPRVKNPPKVCPNCKTDEIDYGDISIDGNQASQKCMCIGCDTVWHEVFQFSHIEIEG